MNNYEFVDLFLEEYQLYLLSLISSVLLYIFIFRNYVRTIFDPLFISLTFSSFGTAIVFFLIFTHSLSTPVAVNYIATQTAFFVGLFSFRKSEFNNSVLHRTPPSNLSQINFCYYFFCVITILCHLIIYKLRGIPLFLPSRLEAYVGGTGIGILSRIVDISLLCAILCYYLLLGSKKTITIKVIHHVLFLGLIIFLILSGSKAAVLNIMFCLFCIKRFYPSISVSLKNSFPLSLLHNRTFLILFGSVTALIIIGVQKNETPLNPFQELGLRFISSGDVYYMSYPNNVYKLIDSEHGFLALFQDALGFFRIYAWEDLPVAIGLDLIKYHHIGDVIWGPNARHNIFGLIYYGYVGSIIFSLLLGLIVGFLRNKFLMLSGSNVFSFLLYSLLYMKIVMLETDPMLGFTYLNNVLVIFPALLVLFLMIYEFKLEKGESEAKNN